MGDLSIAIVVVVVVGGAEVPAVSAPEAPPRAAPEVGISECQS